ncbi:transcriptional regulator, TetR family [Desulfarculus baarsii DSM 2075]|uniref:Transcriptional regulator, TetR family n=1 Tax=Desulfarculus baarsii (strain ATCC 33931 / DSM 2075 / LMG 7858 / VKM B-1802 / 2st14) TaxID=644282 RepID=E1QI91_DESB2|nr:TetR/AcrR family transcriptional regulator [Desulfarculus baarsii]ADK85408.1 transcriptional regulator, TetR family [Desulfarculus baarsii DSM 2075]
MNNRQKIIDTALELFNAHGAAAVGTNRIAQKLGISPGNLYYHFKNKQDIIRAIFEMIRADMAEVMKEIPSDLSTEASSAYLLGSMRVVWKYRFFYADLVALLHNDPELRRLFLAMRAHTVSTTMALYRRLIQAGQMNQPEHQWELDSLTLNTWIVATNWVRYLQTCKSDVDVSQADFERGVLHVYSLVMPYLPAQRREDFLRFYLAAQPD